MALFDTDNVQETLESLQNKKSKLGGMAEQHIETLNNEYGYKITDKTNIENLIATLETEIAENEASINKILEELEPHKEKIEYILTKV